MDKDEVVSTLKEMADLLEVAEANEFEVRAYRTAAQTLDDWQGELQEIVEQQGSIPSLGKKTGQVVSELVTEGSSGEHTRIRGLVPEGLPQLLRVRGLGPKRVRQLWQELGVENAADLKSAADEGRVAKLKGFGAKTVEKIVAGLEYVEQPRVARVERKPSEISAPTAETSTGRVRVGTSGYSYPDWKGLFYPEDAKTKDLLEHYATTFNTVEINNTFYRFPTDKVVQQWRSQTPEDFRFAFKAHSRITHKLRLKPDVVPTILDFVERCGQLEQRLGCILFQFPPDFRRDDERLGLLLATLPAGPRYAVEFRHDSWLDEEIFGKLRSANISLVAGDSARKQPVREVTADFVYVRLRRVDYNRNELTEWNDWFGEQASAKRDVMAYFKHDDEGQVAVGIAKVWHLS